MRVRRRHGHTESYHGKFIPVKTPPFGWNHVWGNQNATDTPRKQYLLKPLRCEIRLPADFVQPIAEMPRRLFRALPVGIVFPVGPAQPLRLVPVVQPDDSTLHLDRLVA